MHQKVSTLAVEWIEISVIPHSDCVYMVSPPSRWSGLKFKILSKLINITIVSTLAVEWIEIYRNAGAGHPGGVSTLAVEWIEIGCLTGP